jgi:hypothetical protein
VSRRALALLGAGVALCVSPGNASASQIVGRDAQNPELAVDQGGKALVTYTTPQGKLVHLIAWGAVNALPPDEARKQVSFRLDYSGGWGAFRSGVWKNFLNACRPYTGPPVPWLVTACQAPDGSFWALQAWQRNLPNLGYDPWKAEQSVVELHLSHWTDSPAAVEVQLDWVVSKRFRHLVGRLSYGGSPVYGFGSTSKGTPLDSYGRNIYLDTLDSAYGPGWKRENSFLAHRPLGSFCYGFYGHEPYPGYPEMGKRPPGNGSRYRITVVGPGVTPDIGWEGDDPGDWDPTDPAKVERERAANDYQSALNDPRCRTR